MLIKSRSTIKETDNIKRSITIINSHNMKSRKKLSFYEPIKVIFFLKKYIALGQSFKLRGKLKVVRAILKKNYSCKNI